MNLLVCHQNKKQRTYYLCSPNQFCIEIKCQYKQSWIANPYHIFSIRSKSFFFIVCYGHQIKLDLSIHDKSPIVPRYKTKTIRADQLHIQNSFLVTHSWYFRLQKNVFYVVRIFTPIYLSLLSYLRISCAW